jgi:hypothetical protein
MERLSAQRRRDRARIAAGQRWNPEDPGLAEQRRDFHASRAEEYIRELVDGFPPLTADQRNQLAVLLLAGGDVS